MYELIDISPSVIISYFEAIEKAKRHILANIIIVIAVKHAFHVIKPNFKIRLAYNT